MKILLIILLAIPIGGCWDVGEIDQKDLILAIGLDAVSDTFIRSTLQVPLTESTLPPAAGSGVSKGKKFYTISTVAHTVLGSASEQQSNTPRTLITGHIKSVLINENLARRGIKRYLDLVASTPKTPRSAYIFICRRPAEEILKYIPVQAIVPGIGFSQQMESPLKRDQTYSVQLWKFFRSLDEPGTDPFAPVVSFRQEDETFEIRGLAVFRHDRLIGFLDPEQTRIFGMITGKINSGYLEAPMGSNQFVTYRTITAKSWITLQDQQPLHIKVKIKVNGILSEIAGRLEISDPEYRQIKEQTRRYLENQCRKTISLIQSWEADILDFGLECRNQLPERFDRRTWHRQFKEAKVKVDVDFGIVRSGLYH
ncbi:MAG TPA: Ger(x)C family spore germination protein [Bacillota bacterium]|nr:Ger(x)C family spore germination protein [Bacillota bacterium]